MFPGTRAVRSVDRELARGLGAAAAHHRRRRPGRPGPRTDRRHGGAGMRPGELDELRAAVAEGCRVLAARQLAPGILGHISFRIDESRRSEEHTSELPSLMRISYAVSCLK